MRWLWLFFGWWLMWMLITLVMTTAYTKTLQELSTDEWKCTKDGCEKGFDHWVLVERGFNRTVGHEMRTEIGCYLSGYVAAREGINAACAENRESAEKAFPTLKMMGEGSSAN